MTSPKSIRALDLKIGPSEGLTVLRSKALRGEADRVVAVATRFGASMVGNPSCDDLDQFYWKLAQRLAPLVLEAVATQGPEVLRPAVVAARRAADMPIDATEEEVAVMTTAAKLSQVKQPGGALGLALDLARAHPVTLRPPLDRMTRLALVVGIAYHLARRHDGRAQLPQIRLGELLGCDRKVIDAALRLGVQQKLLTREEPPRKGKGGIYVVHLDCPLLVMPTLEGPT